MPVLWYRVLSAGIMITYLQQTEKQKDCKVDVTWSGSSLKTSSVWIYGHHSFFWKTIHVLAFFFYDTVLLPNKNIQSFHRRKSYRGLTWFDATLVYRFNECNRRIVTSSITFIKSVNQSSIKPCLIVHPVAVWTLMLQKSLYIVCLMNNSVRWIKFSVLVIIWLQNITVVKIKVVMYTTGDCIYFVSRFLIRNKWLRFWLEENIWCCLLCSALRLFLWQLIEW